MAPWCTVGAVPALDALQLLINASRKALLSADSHEQLTTATRMVLEQTHLAIKLEGLAGERAARVKQLEAQIVDLGAEPVPTPPEESPNDTARLRAVDSGPAGGTDDKSS